MSPFAIVQTTMSGEEEEEKITLKEYYRRPGYFIGHDDCVICYIGGRAAMNNEPINGVHLEMKTREEWKVDIEFNEHNPLNHNPERQDLEKDVFGPCAVQVLRIAKNLENYVRNLERKSEEQEKVIQHLTEMMKDVQTTCLHPECKDKLYCNYYEQ